MYFTFCVFAFRQGKANNMSENIADDNGDQTDALKDIFLPSRSSQKDETPKENLVSYNMKLPSIDADCYITTHKRRGLAVIFNHYKFEDSNLKDRDGTHKDRDYLEEVFTYLGFEVQLHEDKKFGKIYSILKEISRLDHSDSDCLVVCVMTHGDKGVLHARDCTYTPETLWTFFTSDKCASLAGKPKLFFIQACRGNKVDHGVRFRATQTDGQAFNSDFSYSIPVMADMLVMYSTYDGFYSWRNPDSGAWFIQALCTELRNHHETRDLMTILTFVNRHVATKYESNSPHHPDFHKKKQICPIVSMLTRLLYLTPKELKQNL